MGNREIPGNDVVSASRTIQVNFPPSCTPLPAPLKVPTSLALPSPYLLRPIVTLLPISDILTRQIVEGGVQQHQVHTITDVQGPREAVVAEEETSQRYCTA